MKGVKILCELFSEEANKKLDIFLNNFQYFPQNDERRFADFVYQSIIDYCRVDYSNIDKFREYLKYKFHNKEIDVWINIYRNIEYLVDMIMRTFQNYGEIISQIYNIEERY